jgi:RNA polymerase sigma-70 factor, ECF subfamily
MDRNGIDDNEIINRVLDGDVDAYEWLLDKYEAMVLNILKKRLPFEHVEETAQIVLIKAYQSLPTFKRKSEFRNWLSSIAVKTCYDFWRKYYKNKEQPISFLSEKHEEWLEQALSNQSEEALREKGKETEAKELLDWALGKLSPENRMVLELVYLEGMTNKEASDLLGWTVANVKVRSFRARKKLEKILRDFTKNSREL